MPLPAYTPTTMRQFTACTACLSQLRRRCIVRPSPFALPSLVPRRSYTHANAPKPTLDIKHIRQNPGLYQQNCIDRNYGALHESPWRIIALFDQWQACQHEARGLRERNNILRKALSGDALEAAQRETLLVEAKELKHKLAAIEKQEKAAQKGIDELAIALPNLSSTDTPVGGEPAVVGYINEHPEQQKEGSPDRVWKSHVQIGTELGLLDFAGAATTSGWGWYYLLNEGAMLEQALVQYALSVARSYGWTVVAPPSIVYAHIAAACGFQPRDQNGEQQVYMLEQAQKDKTKPSLALAGTAEIPLAGMKASTVLEESELPLKTVGVSRCYRAEAGARGVDTKGLYRVHEFTKVEMFAWTLPDTTANTTNDTFTTPSSTPPSSQAVFDQMLAIQTEILTSLGLHCRILEMPTTDLGASAVRKRDMEAFFPSRRDKDEGWGEVTSTSSCTDYQTRRLQTRVKMASGKLEFPYTLNGTALAVPRVLAALLENGWDEERRCVRVPEVLRPWMGGMEVIERGQRGGGGEGL